MQAVLRVNVLEFAGLVNGFGGAKDFYRAVKIHAPQQRYNNVAVDLYYDKESGAACLDFFMPSNMAVMEVRVFPELQGERNHTSVRIEVEGCGCVHNGSLGYTLSSAGQDDSAYEMWPITRGLYDLLELIEDDCNDWWD